MLSPAVGLSTNECIKFNVFDFIGSGWGIKNEPPDLYKFPQTRRLLVNVVFW